MDKTVSWIRPSVKFCVIALVRRRVTNRCPPVDEAAVA